MRVTIVSPHLDDAVLSIGGTIRRLTRRGASVTVVTVFAGDPEAETPPSYWDAGRGESTQGGAVRQRRREDDAAAAQLGADTLALPWPDSGYVAARDPVAIWDDLGPVVGEADVVVVPGYPLSHADHRYSTLLVLERLDPAVPVVFYAEQPYASEPLALLKAMLRKRSVAPVAFAYGAEVAWRLQPLDAQDRATKEAAVANYLGEVRNLGLRNRWRRTYSRVSRGEWLGFGLKTPVPDWFEQRG